MSGSPEIVDGDLLNQTGIEVIVNPWNRNFIPWWLLLPQGVSGAIRRRAGTDPFRELARAGAMSLGQAVLTSAGHLGFRGIIHVAALHAWWTASERSIRLSVRSALDIVRERGFSSVAFPLIGAGTGGVTPMRSETLICEEIERSNPAAMTRIVRFRKLTQ